MLTFRKKTLNAVYYLNISDIIQLIVFDIRQFEIPNRIVSKMLFADFKKI